MDEAQVNACWEGNAAAWTQLARAGYDICRDHINTPTFLGMLGDVRGLHGLDIGCGEAHNTRQVARRGALMTAIEPSPTFLAAARRAEADAPLGIRFIQASGSALPFADAAFDFVMATMSLMDMPHPEVAIREAARVLRPGGFLQFSITHPCFQTARWKWVLNEQGQKIAVECGGYFFPPPGRVDVWIFGGAPPEARQGLAKFRVPRFDHTLSWWLNTLTDAGFVFERAEEPYADDDALRQCPSLADTRIIAMWLHLRCRRGAQR